MSVIETTAIVMEGIGKKYRLYDSPNHRLLEALDFTQKTRHREFWALRDISLEIARGQTYGIIGKNGSGKSTLLKIISGVLEPTEGTAKVHGKVSALLELGSGFNPEYTGLENIYFNGAVMGYTRSQIEAKIDAILSFADIGSFISQPVKVYSSGMLLRLAFSVSINMDLDILVIDEALTVGDVFFRQKCYKKLEELRADGVPIILVSHAMLDIQQYCDEVLVLERGMPVFEGDPTTAVKKYFLLQQGSDAPFQDSPENDSVTTQHEKAHLEFWPKNAVFIDLTDIPQVGNGWAKCNAVGICDKNGEACKVFQQGELASIYMEFDVFQNIEIPVGGVMIRSDRGILVHGKTTLEHNCEVPHFIRAGSRVRLRQNISLDIAVGEYVLDVGFACCNKRIYEARSRMSHAEFASRIIRVCHLSGVGSFTVSWRENNTGTKLMHHGLCNLPGDIRMDVIANDTEFLSRSSAPIDDWSTIFHITHWKAGSQWIYKILRDCFGDNQLVRPEIGEGQVLKRPIELGKIYPTVYITKEQFDSIAQPNKLSKFVVIRDLRDTLISGYFSIKTSHKLIDERLVLWRNQLETMSTEDGLLYLLDVWLPPCAAIQDSWLEAGEDIIKYEDLLERDYEILEDVFINKCRLSVEPAILRQAVENNRFQILTGGRKRGDEDVFAHERKGISGDWQNYFTDRLKRTFKKRFGRLLVEAGYESDDKW